MIYSKKYNYLFVELPRTGTTAISNELQEKYEGISILKKHSTYRDFKKNYKNLEKEPFVFSCIRNPIDRTLSYYLKSKNGYYDYKLKEDYSLSFYEKYYLMPLVKKIKENDLSFIEYVKKYFFLAYSDWSVFDHKDFNYIIHFENLNNEFLSALRKIGVKPVRDLPLKNKTIEKKKGFEDYIKTQEEIKITVKKFGPFTDFWNYEFPENYNIYSYNNIDVMKFKLMSEIIAVFS